MNDEQNLYRLKANYVGKLERARNTAKGLFEIIIKYMTIEYDRQMDFHVDMESLYKMREEYNKKMNDLNFGLKRIDELYNEGLLILRGSDELPNKRIDSILNFIKSEYRKYIPLGTKNGVLLKWKKEVDQVSEKELKNMKSRINNLSTKALRRLNEAKKLYHKIAEYRKGSYMRIAITSEEDKSKLIKAIQECDAFCHKTDQSVKNCDSLFSEYKETFESYDGKELSLDMLNYFEKHITDIITLEYAPFLNNADFYRVFIKNYDDEKIKKENAKYNRLKSKVKLEMLKNLPKLYSELQIIDGLNNQRSIAFRELNKESAIDEIYSTYDIVSENLKAGKVKFINDSYRYILYFYASNDILDKLPNEVYFAYSRFLMDSNNIDEALIIIKREFFNCYYNTYYDINNDNYMDKARSVLLDKIERAFNMNSVYGIDIDDDIRSMYSKRNKMDIVDLYELYQILNNCGNVFRDDKEVKFSK